MKLACLLAVAALVVLGLPAHAYSPLLEINPQRLDALPLAFEIQSARRANGDLECTVKISERTMKLRTKFSTALSAVHVTPDSMSSQPVRPLPSVREGKEIRCVFTVTAKELEDPDLSFYFAMPVEGHPAVDHFYARLKNFVKP